MDIDARAFQSNNTPLHWAVVSTGHSRLAQLLLQQGANPMATTINHYTPLHYAAKEGDVEAARLLVQAGADPHAKNKMDRTPLQIAMRNNDEKMVIALLHK